LHYAMCRATSHCVGTRASPEKRYAWNQYYYPYNSTTVHIILLAINGWAYSSRALVQSSFKRVNSRRNEGGV
ncbi:hypothetical protein FIBSPDRAFT_846877, partial [Athelia psychrophila]